MLFSVFSKLRTLKALIIYGKNILAISCSQVKALANSSCSCREKRPFSFDLGPCYQITQTDLCPYGPINKTSRVNVNWSRGYVAKKRDPVN